MPVLSTYTVRPAAVGQEVNAVRAFVYHGPHTGHWDNVQDPVIEQPTDALVRVDAATVCAGDLHMLRGEDSEVRPGTVLGHEAVGEIMEVGPEVHALVPGDEVIISSISACGYCLPCGEGAYGQCAQGGGWLLGHEINGTQADFVRVPFADHSTHKLPYGLDMNTAVLFSEALPAAFELGVRNGKVRPGDLVAVVGAGPVGLAVVSIADIFSPSRVISVDLLPRRSEMAVGLGADAAELPGRLLAELSEGPGADVVIGAAGTPDSFTLCTRAVRSGGRIANIGMHNSAVTLHLEHLWRKNVTISTGQVDTSSTRWLLDTLTAKHLERLSRLITRELGFAQTEEAYKILATAAETGEMRTALRRPG